MKRRIAPALLAAALLAASGGCDSRTVVDPPLASDRGTGDDDAPPAPRCPLPKVFCAKRPPACPAGQYPEAQPYNGGQCPGRCWTGKCLRCGSQCSRDADCVLVGRHGCCPLPGPCVCMWAEPTTALASDRCLFSVASLTTCGNPSNPPAGCPTKCDPTNLPAYCKACPHCGADGARCEGGVCVAYRTCEPSCTCA